MGSAWSVFAIPAAEVRTLAKAFKRHGLKEATLVVGRALEPVAGSDPWVAFGIEHKTSGYFGPANQDDLKSSFFSAFERMVSLTGDGNSDWVVLRPYVQGQLRVRKHTTFGFALYPWCKTLGFNLMGLARFGNFGINGAGFRGDSYPLKGALPTLDPAAFKAPSIPAELKITESTDVLYEASREGGTLAEARFALALIYRMEDPGEGIWMLGELVDELPEDDPITPAAKGLLALED